MRESPNAKPGPVEDGRAKRVRTGRERRSRGLTRRMEPLATVSQMRANFAVAMDRGVSPYLSLRAIRKTKVGVARGSSMSGRFASAKPRLR
jgi:hypothetical protein